MTTHDDIRHTVEGMIRNFGTDAAPTADAIAARIGEKSPDGRQLWSSVAYQIRTFQAGRKSAAVPNTSEHVSP